MNFELQHIITTISFSMLLLALIIAFIRLYIGPTVNDRITALDLIASIVMGFILVYSVVIGKALYFDIAIIISLVSFIGTIAISTYLKQKNEGSDH
jgi:multicomponent Na+:H+ antiporter subunit F